MTSKNDYLADSLKTNILVGIHDIQLGRVKNTEEAEVEIRALLRVFRVAEFTAVGEGSLEAADFFSSTKEFLESKLNEVLTKN